MSAPRPGGLPPRGVVGPGLRGDGLPLPAREAQLASAIGHFQRDGLVLIKDRPGHVADDLERWAAAQGIPTQRSRRVLGRAGHWEIRRT